MRGQRNEIWCIYTVQGDLDEDEEEPNAFRVFSRQRDGPCLGDLMRSYARSRPVGNRGERWHWRVRVLDESHGHAWMDVTDESTCLQVEAIAPNSYSVFAKLLDTSARASLLRVTRCTRRRITNGDKDCNKFNNDYYESGSAASSQQYSYTTPAPDDMNDDDELDYAVVDNVKSSLASNFSDRANPSPSVSFDIAKPPPPATNSAATTNFFDTENEHSHLHIDDEPVSTLSPAEEKARMQQAIHERKQSLADTIADNQNQAKEEMRKRQEQEDEEQKECDRLRQTLGPKLKDWSEEFGRKKNIRALLAGMDKVMWAEANWKSISIADLLEPSKVKKAYYKASRYVHPDKLVGLSVEQRFIGKTIFDALTQAMTEFEQSGHN
mmetsp:Transcript_7792/g.10870  ORF Transcript_7792/g.10870 Transcript_7792/m.10870 type:complete len:381 (+) Transcript_7792:49-1191(+)|eukprot:CAMPEP_0197315846 /NCGR_PEP_ID=MMETSP0891-20130614/39620_1 /TAXON_ID=44058 ORGANISM="Aureoumbra lagunensis, Strain CCMP1510" /NCGR_SAMPLE_ID=MMETSP0891 /ASSEMBLY_ACC=CAM_ASM_000534 /LENGTH=380 /DNA_ID=CAMNT_0042805001 /DNA_START=28 /DNA_END=1170 /DNA_ORIENTATION=+